MLTAAAAETPLYHAELGLELEPMESLRMESQENPACLEMAAVGPVPKGECL